MGKNLQCSPESACSACSGGERGCVAVQQKVVLIMLHPGFEGINHGIGGAFLAGIGVGGTLRAAKRIIHIAHYRDARLQQALVDA